MIGVSCTGFSSLPAERWAGPVSEHFGLWEIFSEADQSVPHHIGEISDVLSRYGLECQIHAPICDWNIAAMSDRLREASLQETFDVLDAAAELDAKVVTVHPGLSSMAVPGLEDRAVARAKDAVRRISKHADDAGVIVGIENMPSPPFFLGRTASQLAEIVEGTDLGVTFDIGHANTTGQIDAVIDLLGDRFVNIHIHDNDGTRDSHLAIGEGTIDFGHVIRRLSGYRGNWIIESKSLDSALRSLPRLEMLLSSSGIHVGSVRSRSSFPFAEMRCMAMHMAPRTMKARSASDMISIAGMISEYATTAM